MIMRTCCMGWVKELGMGLKMQFPARDDWCCLFWCEYKVISGVLRIGRAVSSGFVLAFPWFERGRS
jgi:hypothetical protein